MGKFIDEAGNKYGRLTVIEREGSIRGQAAWKCLCECGNYTIVAGSQLRQGITTSCGCRKKETCKRGQDPSIKVGDVFGNLTVIKDLGLFPYYNTGRNRRKYLCQCKCGSITEVWGNSIKSGHKSSCGCLSSKGELKIMKLLDDNNILYKKEVLDDRLIQQYNRHLRFDFGIYNKKNEVQRYIEFDGRQHFQGMDAGVWSNSETLEAIQERDNIKNEFCLQNNIPLIRIPYTILNKITLNTVMGDDYLVKRKKE